MWLYNHVRKKNLSTKLSCYWEGPYLIIEKIGDTVYRLQRTPKSKSKTVSYDRLKPYQGTSFEPWPINSSDGDVLSPPEPEKEKKNDETTTTQILDSEEADLPKATAVKPENTTVYGNRPRRNVRVPERY